MPDSDQSLGDEAVEWCRRIGLTLDVEQELILRSWLGVREDGRWQCFEFGVCMPRQNGKGEILMARELFGLFVLGERYIVHSAHEFKTSERHRQRLEGVIRSCPELFAQVARSPKGRVVGFTYSHGNEGIELQDGRRIEFRTRTKSGMRGFDDVSLLVLDEAMILSETAHGSMIPTLRASKAERGPQLAYAGSAVDQESQPHGIVFARVRERALAGNDPSLAYAEYSLDYEHPHDVPDEVASDPAVWALVNIAIGRGRVLEEHMARERRSMGFREFVVELLGVGDWPATDGSVDVLITAEAWADVEDEDSVLVDPICLAFDVSPDRKTAIVAAGMNQQGKLHIEVIHSGSGTGWIAERMEQLYRSHEVVDVVCDGYGPSAAIARKIDEAGIKVTRLNASEYAQACGLFVDAVGEKAMRHIGQQDLDVAIRTAKARPLVDRWAWSRTKSVGDITTLVASTIVVWSAVEKDIANANLAIF